MKRCEHSQTDRELGVRRGSALAIRSAEFVKLRHSQFKSPHDVMWTGLVEFYGMVETKFLEMFVFPAGLYKLIVSAEFKKDEGTVDIKIRCRANSQKVFLSSQGMATEVGGKRTNQ